MYNFDDAIIKNIKELEENENVTIFKMELDENPKKDFSEKLCIEIANHTPDAKPGKNEDEKNEKRLNPYVGAILIQKENKRYIIYGACRSAIHNGEHGECGLLTNILGDHIVRGCEMYVSLEPCTQESRHEWTEPCCEIIKNRGIKKVTVGMLDPNPDVAGHGISYLIKNGIEIELFSPKNQKIVIEKNKDFSKQFGDDGDPRTNRKIARILDSYVSNEAIKSFIESCNDELYIPFSERFEDNKKFFYKRMIENRSIIDGKSSLLPFDVIDDFALFFFKKPYNKVDGATIRYIFETDNGDVEIDSDDYDFDLPYACAFSTYDSFKEQDVKKMGFIECVGKRYSGSSGKSILDYYNFGIEFIKEKLGINEGIEVVREAFINSIMHRDYKNNLSFTKIILKDECIEIYNPVSRIMGEIVQLKDNFTKFNIPSHPVNPKLMRYFQMIRNCERNGNGLKTLKRSGTVKLELNDDYILKTIITYRKSH